MVKFTVEYLHCGHWREWCFHHALICGERRKCEHREAAVLEAETERAWGAPYRIAQERAA